MTEIPKNLLLSDLLKDLTQQATNIPLIKTKLLLSHIIGCSLPELGLIHKEISPSQLSLFYPMFQRLKRGEPLQYILGVAHFYGLELKVNANVLIPRPETEGLVELILQKAKTEARVIDIGTGSGAIAITLKKLRPDLDVYATDLSLPALQLAKENANIQATEVSFIHCDLFPSLNLKFDLIISNPPYISDSDYQLLPTEVKDYEPSSALLAEEHGVAFYRRILQIGKAYSLPHTQYCFEVGETQAEQITEIARMEDYTEVQVKQDLNARDRYMFIGENVKALQ